MKNNLYDRDFNLWIDEIVKALKTKNFAAMDWDNSIEEIEDMGRSQKNASQALLTVDDRRLILSIDRKLI